jgi:photosystem II stability/assembly factor-like uncharacterized protein
VNQKKKINSPPSSNSKLAAEGLDLHAGMLPIRNMTVIALAHLVFMISVIIMVDHAILSAGLGMGKNQILRFTCMLKINHFLLLLILFLLTACGPLDIRVEPLVAPTQAATSIPTSLPTFTAPSSTSTPAPRVMTVTPSFTPMSSPNVPDLHLKVGTPVKIILTHMLTLQTGWAIGESDLDLVQHILVTADSGKTWKDTTPSEVLAAIPEGGLSVDPYFASMDSAWALFYPRKLGGPDSQQGLVVWHTGDGGNTWNPSQTLDLNGLGEGMVEFQIPSYLGFQDAQHGWVLLHLGAGMSHDYFAAFTSSDGGMHWKRILDPNTKIPIMGCQKSGFTFTSAASGWITGNCPGLMPKLFIFHTTDGGTTWEEADLPLPPGKPADYFASGIACGINAIDYSSARSLALTLTCTNFTNNTAQSWLYTSGDAGQTWRQSLLPVLYTYIDLLTADEGFLVGSMNSDSNATGAIYHTTDGGVNWLFTTSTGWTGQPDFVDAQNGWVVAIHNQVSAFVHTVDGGRTWIELKPVIGS